MMNISVKIFCLSAALFTSSCGKAPIPFTQDNEADLPDRIELDESVIESDKNKYSLFHLADLDKEVVELYKSYKYMEVRVTELAGDSTSLTVLHKGQVVSQSGPKLGLAETTISLDGKTASDFSFKIGEDREKDTAFFSTSVYKTAQSARMKITFVK